MDNWSQWQKAHDKQLSSVVENCDKRLNSNFSGRKKKKPIVKNKNKIRFGERHDSAEINTNREITMYRTSCCMCVGLLVIVSVIHLSIDIHLL